MFKNLCKAWYDTDFEPSQELDRSKLIEAYKKMYSGTLYDVLQHDFCTETVNDGVYVPISDRIPCVQTNLAKVVVDETTALVFGESHFPRLKINDDDSSYKFATSLIKTCKLNKIMQDAMIIGSTGSVCIFMVLVDGKPHFYPQSTEHLTPIYDPLDPRRLVKIVEKVKMPTKLLNAQYGYNLSTDYMEHWVLKELNEENHIVYNPIPVSGSHILDESKIRQYGTYKMMQAGQEEVELREVNDYSTTSMPGLMQKIVPSIDKKRSKEHNLGFCPAVWIKNMPTMNTWDIDGGCTFGAAVETIIALDYTLSQAYRALKYSSEPVLMVSDPSGLMPKKLTKSANKVLMLGKDADAKWLEINGSAATASIDYAKHLREVALEALSGNRVTPEKIHAAQSGKAMELMNQPLIWLCEKFRSSYGEFGLVKIIELAIKANALTPIRLRDGVYGISYADPEWTVELDWPDWFDATGQDLMAEANALAVMRNEGLISRETALRSQAENYNVTNITEELALAEQEAEQFNAEMKPQVQEKFAN